MSLHDEYARVTPFELALQDEDRVSGLIDAATEEAEGRGVDLEELDGFLTLGAAAALVAEVAGVDADPSTLHRFGPLAYHAVRFASAGRPVYLLSTHAVRYLAEGAPDGEPAPPTDSGYVQLPQHLVWTRAAEDAPESVDGIFWSTTPSGLLHSLLVTGIRPDRPGLGVVPLPAGPLDDAPGWLELDAREDGGADFTTDLPGAELDALYEIRTAGEVFKLLGRFFAYLDASPDAVTGERKADGATEDDGPTPSALPFRRVTLGVGAD